MMGELLKTPEVADLMNTSKSVALGGSGLMFWAAYKQGAMARRIDLLCGWVFGLSCAATVGLMLNFVK